MDGGGRANERMREQHVLTARRERGREDCGEQEAHRGYERARERYRERERTRTTDLAGEGDQREDWIERTGSPIYKGELGDYDLPFVRSFQLFCPIKISIFSPITAALTGLPFAVAPALPRSSTVLYLLRPPFNPPTLTLHTVASTVPNLP